MATVNVGMHVEGIAYKIPLPQPEKAQHFAGLEEGLLVIAGYIEQAIPGNEEIWMFFEKGKADKKNNFKFYSPTVPVKKILGIFDEFKA